MPHGKKYKTRSAAKVKINSTLSHANIVETPRQKKESKKLTEYNWKKYIRPRNKRRRRLSRPSMAATASGRSPATGKVFDFDRLESRLKAPRPSSGTTVTGLRIPVIPRPFPQGSSVKLFTEVDSASEYEPESDDSDGQPQEQETSPGKRRPRKSKRRASEEISATYEARRRKCRKVSFASPQEVVSSQENKSSNQFSSRRPISIESSIVTPSEPVTNEAALLGLMHMATQALAANTGPEQRLTPPTVTSVAPVAIMLTSRDSTPGGSTENATPDPCLKSIPMANEAGSAVDGGDEALINSVRKSVDAGAANQFWHDEASTPPLSNGTDSPLEAAVSRSTSREMDRDQISEHSETLQISDPGPNTLHTPPASLASQASPPQQFSTLTESAPEIAETLDPDIAGVINEGHLHKAKCQQGMLDLREEERILSDMKARLISSEAVLKRTQDRLKKSSELSVSEWVEPSSDNEGELSELTSRVREIAVAKNEEKIRKYERLCQENRKSVEDMQNKVQKREAKLREVRRMAGKRLRMTIEKQIIYQDIMEILSSLEED